MILYTIINEYDVLCAQKSGQESDNALQQKMLSTDLNDFLTDTRLQIKLNQEVLL